MLKFITPLALAAITVISIAPKSQAIPINLNSIYIGQNRDGDTRVKAVIQVGDQPDYSNRWDVRRRREWEAQRERAAERRRHRYYSQNDRRYSDYRNSDYHNSDYSDDYRRSR
jgi:hypothetical protein